MRRVLPVLAVIAAACGGDDDGGAGPDGGPTIDGGGGGGDGGGGCDVAPSDITCEGLEGAWTFENVSGTPETISHDGRLAISQSGAMQVAFSEPLPDPLFDQDIATASRDGSCDWTSSPLTKDTDVQNAYPSLAVAGEDFHLVWSGYPEGLNDVYYAHKDGAGPWSDRVNLTAAHESAMMRHAYAPSISIGPDGTIAIAYLSAPDLDPGIGIAEVRVAVLEGDTLAGEPVTVIPAADDGCYNPRAIHDGDGNLHVLAECGPIFNQDIVWATDAGPGPWKNEPLPGTAGHDDLSITVARAGGTVHAAWAADLPCGDGTCRTLFHSELSGSSWTEPANASQAGEPADNAPALAIGPDDTIYIAFWRDNADAKSDVYLTLSADGETFSAPCNLTRTTTENEWMPSELQLDPSGGTLHLLYEQFVPGSDPLDTEIIHAHL